MKYRDVTDSNANEWRDLNDNEKDCVLTVQDFVKGRWNIDVDTCQVFTQLSTCSILVRGKLTGPPNNAPSFEAEISRNGTISFKI